MPSSFSFRRKSLFSKRKGGRKLKKSKKRILKDKKPIKKRFLKDKKPIKKPILKRIEERRKPKKRKINKGKAPSSFAVAVILAVNTNGYHYIYHTVFKINVWSSFLQKIRELRSRPSTVDMWIFTTSDLVEGRLKQMISNFQDELREYKNRIGKIYKLDGRILTDFDVEVYGHIVLGELQTKVEKYGPYIQQRSIDEWDEKNENQSY